MESADVREPGPDLRFTEEARFRPHELVSPGFVRVHRPAAGPCTGTVRAEHGPPAPFAAVEVEVADAGEDGVLAGLATAWGDHVVVTYEPAHRRVGVEVRHRGTTHRLRHRRVGLPPGSRFAFVLCENQVTALIDSGAGWRPVLTERARVAAEVDLRAASSLAGYRYAWGAHRQAGLPPTLGAVRAGVFGMTGLRDPHLVQHSDGRPYRREGRVFLTFTCAGTGFFQQAHWGVFSLDPAAPTRLEQVSQLFSVRDGLVLGDHAGQLVRDDEHDRWVVVTSSWGDFSGGGVHVRHATTAADVLEGVHLLETTPLPLPTSLSTWDPGAARIDGRWHVSFVESPSQRPFAFHPALAAAAPGTEWPGELRMVGSATGLQQCEGPLLTRVEGDWWLLASDGAAREYPVFTPGMERAGSLDAPYPTNIPHPQIVPVDDEPPLLVTFDGTPFARSTLGYGTHGDVIVMRGSPRRRGR